MVWIYGAANAGKSKFIRRLRSIFGSDEVDWRGEYLPLKTSNRAELKTQLPKKLVEELPIMQIIPIEAARLKLQNTIKTPVYSTQIRKNAMGFGLVFEADLATPQHISLWVLQGVALSLNTDQ